MDELTADAPLVLRQIAEGEPSARTFSYLHASTWTSPAVTWLGRTAVAVLTALAGVALIRDVVAIL